MMNNIEAIYNHLSRLTSGELFRVFPLDARDIIKEEVMWADHENRSANISVIRANMDAFARSLGWKRARMPDNSRKWLSESDFLEYRRQFPGYRNSSGKVKRDARMKVTPERRKAIATLGGLANRRP